EDEYLEAAKLCLEKGADVNAVNKQGFTAMHGAANRGFDKMVQLLADHAAKLDVKDSQGRTPMMYAEGVFLAVQPPVRKPSTIALLEKLMKWMGAADYANYGDSYRRNSRNLRPVLTHESSFNEYGPCRCFPRVGPHHHARPATSLVPTRVG